MKAVRSNPNFKSFTLYSLMPEIADDIYIISKTYHSDKRRQIFNKNGKRPIYPKGYSYLKYLSPGEITGIYFIVDK